MSTHRVVISIGSNSAADVHVPAAMDLLRHSYQGIRFSTPLETEPINFPFPSGPFTNVTADFYSDESPEAICRNLKDMESHLGRIRTKPFDGRVAIDLDLIIWDSQIMKDIDYSRPYIQAGLRELGININTQFNMMKESKSEAFFHAQPNNWNCAQSIQKGLQEVTGMTDEEIEAQYRSKGGGRAEGGLCGALYAANCILEAKGLKPVTQEFEAYAGATTCRALKGELKFPCIQCVRLAENLAEQRLSSLPTEG